MKVSVIVPTYNDQGTISQALESLEEQTFQDFELIVVDDGDDETADIARNFGCTVIERHKSGIASALNEGVSRASGRYIARQDADDTSEPTRLEKEFEYLEEHEDVGLVGTGAYLWDGETKRGRRHVLETVEHSDLLDKNHLIHGSVLMRKGVLKRAGGYDENLDYIEDLDLWIRMARETNVRNIDEPLYNFTIHGESIYAERLQKIKFLEQYVRARERTGIPDDVEQDVRNGDLSVMADHLNPERLAQMHREITQEYLRYGRQRMGRDEIRKAFSQKPSLMDAALLFLSLFPGQVTKSVANAYRHLLNHQIKRSNER
jgi:glycosyltransferase involved in cell wall biosynthesis